MHTPFKFQNKLKTTAKVIACQTSASQWMAAGFHKFQTFITFAIQLQIQFLKQVWKALKTKNKPSIFQYHTNNNPCATCRQSSASNPQELPRTHKKLQQLRNLPFSTFLLYLVAWAPQPMSPYPKHSKKYFFHFLSIPLSSTLIP